MTLYDDSDGALVEFIDETEEDAIESLPAGGVWDFDGDVEKADN